MGKKKKDTRVSQISNIEDREAHLIFDYDSRTVRLYTNNATVMNRLDKQGIKYYREDYFDGQVYGREYSLPFEKMNPLVSVTLYK